MQKNVSKSDANMNTNRRKPLPYTANQKLDDVLMANSDMWRTLIESAELIDNVPSLKKLVKMLDIVNKSNEALREIKQSGK